MVSTIQKSQKFNIYQESWGGQGYVDIPAKLIGSAEGVDFREACDAYINQTYSAEDVASSYVSKDDVDGYSYFFGSRLYHNLEDAKRGGTKEEVELKRNSFVPIS